MQQWLMSWDLQHIASSWTGVHEHISVNSHKLYAWCPATSSTRVCFIDVLHTSSAVLELGTCVVVPVHLSHRVYLSRHRSSDWWAGMCSIFIIINWWCFMNTCLSQQRIYAARFTKLCLHWCLHICFLHCAPVHICHKACVSSQMMQCLMSWNLHQTSPSTDDVLSILTYACIGVMHIWALYWNLGTYVVVPVHISHTVCVINWSSDWWSGMRSIFIVKGCCLMTMLSPSAAIMCSKCQHIKHKLMLALMFCTSKGCIWTGHVCWFTVHSSHKIFVSNPVKQQLMSWHLPHITSSTKDVVQFWLQSCAFLLQRTQLHLNWCSMFQFLYLRPWFAKNAMQIVQLDTYRPTPTDFFLGAHTLSLTSNSSCVLSFSVPLNYFWNCWCQLSRNLSNQLQHVNSAVKCQLVCNFTCWAEMTSFIRADRVQLS